MPGTDDTLQGDDVAKPVDDANHDDDVNDVNDANDANDTDAHDADVNDANNATSTVSSDFIDQSYLTYVVPLRTNLDLDQAFKDADAGKSILDSLQQRDALYFGEHCPLHEYHPVKPNRQRPRPSVVVESHTSRAPVAYAITCK